jgi:hypothetical protein
MEEYLANQGAIKSGRCRMIFTFIFGKNENKENINNNIRRALLDQNFIRSQTLEVQTERLSRFPLIVHFILGFLFNFIRILFSFPYKIRFTITTRIYFPPKIRFTFFTRIRFTFSIRSRFTFSTSIFLL